MNNNTEFANEVINNAHVNELLDKYKLNWTVSKQALILPDGNQSEYFSIRRDDTGAEFNAAKKGYEIYQNSQLAELLIKIAEKTGYEIYNGGSFGNGEKVYMQLLTPNKLSNIGKNHDEVKGYVTGINSFDGSTSLGWGGSNVTISCQNTFAWAYKQVQNKARHTQSLTKKVDEYIKNINGIVEAEKSLFDKFLRLADVELNQNTLVKIVQHITKVDIRSNKDEMEKYSTYSKNRANELVESIASEVKQKGNTMWGLFSGVTHFNTHVAKSSDRLASIYTGQAYKQNNEALNIISADSFNLN